MDRSRSALSTEASSKVEWRMRLRARVAALLASERQRQTAAICERIRVLDGYRRAQVVLLYRPMMGEVDLTALADEARDAGRQVFFPRLANASAMRFVRVTSTTPWQHHRLGFLEPQADEEIGGSAARQAAILVPGLGFTRTGVRLGRGRGCYDRALSGPPIAGFGFRIGVGFDEQIVDALPIEPFDVSMHAVVGATGVWLTEHDIKPRSALGAPIARKIPREEPQ